MSERQLRAAEEQISAELVRIHEDSYGAGASGVVTHVLDDVVLVLLDVDITEAERTLLGAGKTEVVRRTREDFQEAAGASFIAVVERATGRRVTSWVSRMSLDPIYAVEVFRLAPS
jgi:uncharacterized protein YbcI